MTPFHFTYKISCFLARSGLEIPVITRMHTHTRTHVAHMLQENTNPHARTMMTIDASLSGQNSLLLSCTVDKRVSPSARPSVTPLWRGFPGMKLDRVPDVRTRSLLE